VKSDPATYTAVYAGDDPVNEGDPSGDFKIPIVHWCIGTCGPPGWTNGEGYESYSIDPDSDVNGFSNNCPGIGAGACSYVWNPIGHLWYTTSPGKRGAASVVDAVVGDLYSHYSQGRTGPQGESCAQYASGGSIGEADCLVNVLLPAMAYMGYSSLQSVQGDWQSLFVGGGDGSLLWWAQNLDEQGKVSSEVPDWVDTIFELAEPALDAAAAASSITWSNCRRPRPVMVA
jgi:hypothetical protein